MENIFDAERGSFPLGVVLVDTMRSGEEAPSVAGTEGVCGCGHSLRDHVEGLCAVGPCRGTGACDGCPQCRSHTASFSTPGPVLDVSCSQCGLLLERKRLHPAAGST